MPWRTSTSRGRSLDLRIVRELARIKRHGANVNALLAVTHLDERVANAIAAACAEIERGDHDDAFAVDVYQTGSGTSTNMNVNEVVAALASGALGRTHLVDAAPVLLGDEFDAWAEAMVDALDDVAKTLPALLELPLGGTAVGTGLNAPGEFAAAVCTRIAAELGLPVRASPSTPRRMSLQAGHVALAQSSGAMRTVALALAKLSNDLRLLASGPRTGLGELRIPELQAGSSIMPGKVNPVLCETANQVAARVLGNDVVVTYAVSQGTLELNTYLPVIADALLESVTLLTAAMQAMTRKVLPGVEADERQCLEYAQRSPALATALAPLIGYQRAAEIVREAIASDLSIRDAALAGGVADASTIDRLLDPRNMAAPHRAADATRR